MTLIGVLEYAKSVHPGDMPAQAMLERVRAFLKPGGCVVIAIENQLGLKYFAGAPEDHLGQAMFGIEGRYRNDQPQTFGRRVLKNILINSGFSHSNFMAPFPDYKLPASIVTEAGFSDPEFDASAFAWQSVRRDLQLPQLLSFSPELAWPGIFDNALALDLANSFLVVASSVDTNVVDRKVLAYHFSTDRRAEYCKETSFVRKEDSHEIKVACRLFSSPAIARQHASTLFRPEAESDYVRGSPLSREFVEIVSRDGWCFDDVVAYFKRYLDILFRLTNSAGEPIYVAAPDRDGYVLGRFIDALPQNILCMPHNIYRLIDTEWQGTANVPIGRILFRSILLQMFGLTRFGQPAGATQPITRLNFIVEIFSRLGLEKSVADFDEFLKSESIFQEMVTGRPADQFMQWWPDSTLPTENLSLAVPQRNAQIAGLSQAVEERDIQIAGLSQAVAERDIQIARLAQEVDSLRDPTSWRLTKPVRFVGDQVARGKHLARIAPLAFQIGGGPRATLKKALGLYRKEGLAGIKRGIRIVQAGPEIKPAVGSEGFDRHDYAEWVRRYDTIDDAKRQKLSALCDGLASKPKISVVMPTYNPKPKWLIEAIESVRGQIYPNWELCIADDASPDPAIRPILERYAREDERIKVVFREQNGHISAASNSALELATGEWIALLDHDDLLPEHALALIAQAINRHPGAGLIYSDEDKIDEQGNRSTPYFKCEFNIDLLRSQNMICHLGVYHSDLVKRLGGFRLGFEGSQDYDLALRVVESLDREQIVHVPHVLYHWRIHPESTAMHSGTKSYAQDAGLKALREHLQRQSVDATVEPTPFLQYRIRYALPVPPPKVSLIIPTRNGLHLIRQCIESILTKTTYENYEILVIDNGSDDPEVLNYFATFDGSVKVRVIRDDSPFNFSALNNKAVIQADGEFIALLNNDVEVITPEWLEEMLCLAVQPGRGAIGASLWYPDETLQHGGVIMGVGGVAGHANKKLPRGALGYFGRAGLVHGVSGVTAACLLINKSIYLEVGGLNETDLQVAFNDVDFCLKVREAGYQNVWTPFAELYHHESATRGFEDTPEKQARFAKEVAYMKHTWGESLVNDPTYNPNLTLEHEDFSLAWPPRIGLS